MTRSLISGQVRVAQTAFGCKVQVLRGQTSPAWSVADSSAGAVITIVDHGTITLTGVTVAQLNADDFIFS